MKSTLDIVYNRFGQMLDVHIPDGEAKGVFVYFHGGGLEFGHKNHKEPYIAHLLKNNIAVADVSYRLYPEAKYPDFVEDAADAVAWVVKNIHSYADTSKVFVGGSSAGGYLSMMLCFNPEYLASRGVDPLTISGYVHDAGQPTAHFNVLRERGIDTRRVIVDDSCPLYHVGAHGNACVPMTFIVSDDDMENRYEQTMLMLSTLRHFRFDMSKISHTVMHGTHCSYVSTLNEAGESKLGILVTDFINGVVGA